MLAKPEAQSSGERAYALHTPPPCKQQVALYASHLANFVQADSDKGEKASLTAPLVGTNPRTAIKLAAVTIVQPRSSAAMPPHDEGTPDENLNGDAPASKGLRCKDEKLGEGAQLATTLSIVAASDEVAQVNPRKRQAIDVGDANIAVACRKSSIK